MQRRRPCRSLFHFFFFLKKGDIHLRVFIYSKSQKSCETSIWNCRPLCDFTLRLPRTLLRAGARLTPSCRATGLKWPYLLITQEQSRCSSLTVCWRLLCIFFSSAFLRTCSCVDGRWLLMNNTCARVWQLCSVWSRPGLSATSVPCGCQRADYTFLWTCHNLSNSSAPTLHNQKHSLALSESHWGF